ncbi:MAG: histidine kinase [Candidatus Nitrosotenuis sp.]
MEPGKVPEKLEDKIDLRVLFVILGLVIAFHVLIYVVKDTDAAGVVTGLITTVNPLLSSIMAFYVARRYKNSQVFGKAYLALAIGLFMNFLGALSYYTYSSLGLEAIPSIADVFYLAFYPFTFYHLTKNILFFKPKDLHIAKKIISPIVFTVLVIAYSVVKFQILGEITFEFFYGLSYAFGSAAIFSFVILGFLIFRHGILGTPWLVLVIGISLTTIGDQWYSYLAALHQYDLIHPVNLLWYGGYMVITYSLYKHKKTI